MGFRKATWQAAPAGALFSSEVLRLLDRLVGESVLIGVRYRLSARHPRLHIDLLVTISSSKDHSDT